MFQTEHLTVTSSAANARINVRKNERRVGNDAPMRRKRITLDAGRIGICGGFV
jgi:hypothetical protein